MGTRVASGGYKTYMLIKALCPLGLIVMLELAAIGWFIFIGRADTDAKKAS